MFKDTIIEAMKIAKYHYDDIDSYDEYIKYDSEIDCTSITFKSWKENLEWLKGVVFDDNEIAEKIELLLEVKGL